MTLYRAPLLFIISIAIMIVPQLSVAQSLYAPASTNVQAVLDGVDKVNLTWTDNATDEDYFYIYWQVDGGAYAFVTQLEPDSVSYTHTYPSIGTNTYYIETCNIYGCNDSDTASVAVTDNTTSTNTTYPLFSNVRAENIIGSGAQILWTTDDLSDSAVRYGTVFDVYDFFSYDRCDGGGNVTNHCVNLTGLSVNTYYYKVESRNTSNLYDEAGGYSFVAAADADGSIDTTSTPSSPPPPSEPTTSEATYPVTFPSGLICAYFDACFNWCTGVPGNYEEDISTCELYYPEAIYEGGGSGWVNNNWQFTDGSIESAILDRTDSEYLDYISSVEAGCSLISKNDFVWYPDAGNDGNWQEFGIPDCRDTSSTGPHEAGFFIDVYGTFPRDGDSNVGTDAVIEIAFTEGIDQSGSLDPFVTLAKLQAPNTHLGITVGANQNILTISPNSPLDMNTTYTYTVSPGLASIEDNTLSETFTASFTTGGGTQGGLAELSGVVTGPSGNPVSEAFVEVHTPDWSLSHGAPTDASGMYVIKNIPAGTFSVDVYPPQDTSGLISPESETLTFKVGDTIMRNYAFKPATKKIVGSVKRSTGVAVSGARVGAFQSSTNRYVGTETDAAGSFSLSVAGGSWMVQVEPGPASADWTWAWEDITVTFTPDVSLEEKIVNLTVVSADASIEGGIKLPDGNVPKRDTVFMNFEDGKGGQFNGNLKSDGSFSVKVSAGTYNVFISSEDPLYGAPSLASITVTKGEVKNIGLITLEKRSEKISGSVVDENGKGVSGAGVNAWQPSGSAYAWTKTNTSGAFTLNVTSGDWEVEVHPDDSSVLYNPDPPSRVTVKTSETVSLQFKLKTADARVSGTVVDSEGAVLSGAYGFLSLSTGGVFEEHGQEIGGPIDRGTFSFAAPSGTYKARTFFDSSSLYVTAAPQTITLAPGDSKTITMHVVKSDATITGNLVDENGTTISGVGAHIFAGTSNGVWREATFNKASGTYILTVSPGTWYLGYDIDTDSGYVSVEVRASVTVESGETKTQNITVLKADAVLSGTVLDPSGKSAPFVFVGISETGFANAIESKTLKDPVVAGADTKQDGSYSIAVPKGTYFVKAFVSPDTGFINSSEEKVSLGEGEKKTLQLILRRSDASISGKVTLLGQPVSNAFVWGWSKSGGYQETFVQSDGSYRLNVTANETWVVAAASDGDEVFYKSSETPVAVVDQDIAAFDISLGSPQKTPKSASQTTQASTLSVVETTEGTSIIAPANSISTSGGVSLSVTPDVRAPSQGEVKVVGTAYNFEARDDKGNIITTFNTDVIVTLPYEKEELERLGTTEDSLNLGFWDEKVGTWKQLENSVVNKEEKNVTGAINHFTRFAIIAAADITPPDAPTDIRVTALGSGNISLSWVNPSSDFAHAKVYRSEADGSFGFIRAVEVFTNTFVDTDDISDGITYFYTVRAVDSAGNETDNTNQVSVVAIGSSVEATVLAGFIPPELITETVVSEIIFTRNLTLGGRGADVTLLQELLVNEDVYPEALTTGYFGQLTKAAVMRFQNKYKEEILTPVDLSEGTGYFGESTRSKANERARAHGITASGPARSDRGVATSALARNLTTGSRGNDVKALQEFLNNQGFIVSETGGGSSGNETTYFGTKTKNALSAFQDAYKDEILTLVGLSKGTGFFGPSTRKKVNELLQ